MFGDILSDLAAGLIGTFLVLRKRALLSDTLSHATLPGIALAFIVMTLATGDGKQLPALIAGAAVFSVIGTLSVMVIQRFSRLKDDAALGIAAASMLGENVFVIGGLTGHFAENLSWLLGYETLCYKLYDEPDVQAFLERPKAKLKEALAQFTEGFVASQD